MIELETPSGQPVGPIGFGTMGLGGYFSRDETSAPEARAALETAFDCGIRLFDTAEGYGAGHAEELVGDVLSDVRGDIFLSTKVSPENLTPEALRTAAYGSLERLRTDVIDLYYIHWPNPDIALAETMEAMAGLVDEGVVRRIGLSNYTAREAAAAESHVPGHGIAAVQAEYNLFDRSHEDGLLPFCQDRGLPFIAYSPLDVGRLASDTGAGTLKHLADQCGLTPAQLCLGWTIRSGQVIAIPKALQRTHIEDNAAVAQAEIPKAVCDELSDALMPARAQIDPAQIRVDRVGIDNFVPGPDALGRAIRDGVALKPVRVVACDHTDDYAYALVEGKLRYWAWMAAFPEGRPIPALIRQRA